MKQWALQRQNKAKARAELKEKKRKKAGEEKEVLKDPEEETMLETFRRLHAEARKTLENTAENLGIPFHHLLIVQIGLLAMLPLIMSKMQ